MTDINPLPRTAIDTALIKLGLASQYLEVKNPSKLDVKVASNAAKDAAEILKASLVLLDHDCYTVKDMPGQPGTPLFTGTGAPSPAAEVAPSALPSLGIIDVEAEPARKFKVGDRVKATASSLENEGTLGTVMEDDDSAEDESPYFVRFDDDGPEQGSYQNAEDLELVDADDEIKSEPFPTGTKPQQKKVFEERLATLEDIFCERLDLSGSTEPYGKQLKAFRPHRDAWAAAWKDDAKATWPKLLAAIVEANKVGAEFDAWAPAA